jgi:hypothetical protein
MNAKWVVKRVVWVVVVLAIGAYLLNGYLQKRTREKAEREKAKRIEQSIRLTVDQMVLRFNAVNDWPGKLCRGEKVRTDKILTIELERLWLGQNPILFIGSIQDVSTIDEQSYRVRIERTLFSNLKQILFTEIGLELKCSKHMVDSFLAQHPQLFSDFGLKNGVGVVAKIDHIKTEFFKGKEGDVEEMRVGIGDCLDITYTGNVQF